PALQIGGQLAIFPDAKLLPSVNPDLSLNPSATQYSPGGEEARYPVLEIKLYLGDLGLNGGAQNVNVLNTQQMVPLTQSGEPIPLLLGSTDTLPIVVDGKPE